MIGEYTKKIILWSVCVGCCLAASAQTDLQKLSERYRADERNLQVVKAYVEALEKAGRKQEAEAVIKKYMARCPVVQLSDKDTYLLLGRYVFDDPYSNAFEYGISAVKKMKWEREETKGTESPTARWERALKKLHSCTSSQDEIDKRYEVLAVLSKNLKKEIDKQCDPVLREGQYVMPVYDSLKVEHLTYLVNKGQLLGGDEMRLKLAVTKALHANDTEQVVRNLQVAAKLRLSGINGRYVLAVLSVLAGYTLEKEILDEVLKLVLYLSEQEKREGGTTNYYPLLGRLYALTGDKINAEKYTQLGNAVEVERQKIVNDLFDGFRAD